MARLAWLLILLTKAEAAWPSSCTQTSVDPHEPFGVGGKHDPYDDGAEACWVLKSPGTRLTVYFEFFQTEFQHDYLTVYDGQDDDDPLQVSGELPSPFVLRPDNKEVLLHFKADATYHSGARTQQLGLTAKYFDSSDGSCVDLGHGQCSNHGTCDDGLCKCNEGWGADLSLIHI